MFSAAGVRPRKNRGNMEGERSKRWPYCRKRVMVFNPLKMKSLVAAMPDGTSNTVMIAERILYCDVSVQLYFSSAGTNFTGPAWAWIYPDHGDGSLWAAFGWRTAKVSGSGTINDLRTDFGDSAGPFQVGVTPTTCYIFITQSVHAA